MKIDIRAFNQETSYTCLPACIRIVMHYMGSNKSESEIAKACHTTMAGTRFHDAVQGVQSFGYEMTLIQDGDYGTHAVVVNGFDDENVFLTEPALGKEIQIDLFELFKSWQSRGKKGIIIHRKK